MSGDSSPGGACACEGSPTLVFPCSGSSDVGEIADRAGRRLSKKGVGRMYCLAGVGGRVPEILETTRCSAPAILAIDGCEADCAKRTLIEAGIEGFDHLRLKTMGFEKGSSPPTGMRIEKAAEEAERIIEGMEKRS